MVSRRIVGRINSTILRKGVFMENIKDIFQSGQTHAVIQTYEVDLNIKEIEEFSLYDIADLILEVEENAKETGCTSGQ